MYEKWLRFTKAWLTPLLHGRPEIPLDAIKQGFNCECRIVIPGIILEYFIMEMMTPKEKKHFHYLSKEQMFHNYFSHFCILHTCTEVGLCISHQYVPSSSLLNGTNEDPRFIQDFLIPWLYLSHILSLRRTVRLKVTLKSEWVNK